MLARLLRPARSGQGPILEGEKRRRLLQLQGIELEAHPDSSGRAREVLKESAAHCGGNEPGWFVHDGVTCFEDRYPRGGPRDRSQTFHSVQALKQGKVVRVCSYLFTVTVRVGKYFSI